MNKVRITFKDDHYEYEVIMPNGHEKIINLATLLLSRLPTPLRHLVTNFLCIPSNRNIYNIGYKVPGGSDRDHAPLCNNGVFWTDFRGILVPKFTMLSLYG